MTPAWMLAARCRGVDTATSERFFSDSVAEQRAVIHEFCKRCLVTVECHADALEDDLAIAYGIRGGTTGNQRTQARRQVRAAA